MSAEFRERAISATGGASLTPGQRLRAEFRRLGLDQVAVSRATGVTRQTVNNIVNDRHPISRAMAIKLARLTGERPDYWLQSTFPADAAAASPISDAPARERAGHVLVDHQILCALRDGLVRIEPLAESQVHAASIELTLGQKAMTLTGEAIDLGGQRGFRLKSGRAVKVHTRERIELPPDYIGRAGAAERLAQSGVMALHALQIGPGFRGSLQFCLFNAGEREFPLHAGDPVLSIEITSLASAPAASRPRNRPRALRRRAK